MSLDYPIDAVDLHEVMRVVPTDENGNDSEWMGHVWLPSSTGHMTSCIFKYCS